jgi:hypothetical protein
VADVLYPRDNVNKKSARTGSEWSCYRCWAACSSQIDVHPKSERRWNTLRQVVDAPGVVDILSIEALRSRDDGVLLLRIPDLSAGLPMVA